MNQQDIITVESHKHLGLTFTNDLSWHEHLNNIKTKSWHRINVMRKLKFQLSRKSLQIIYFSFIRPLLEYADVVWDNCTQYEANELEKIQHEAARIVNGATKLVSIDKLLREVGRDTLSCRRNKHKQILFYKIINGLCPDYLSSLVAPTVGKNTAYSLRNASDYKYIHHIYINCWFPLYRWSVVEKQVTSTPPPPQYLEMGGGVLVTCIYITDHLETGNQQLM